MDGQEPNGAVTLDEAVLLSVLSHVRRDFTVRMPVEWTGVAGKIADRLNDVIAANQTLETELARVSRVVGKQGKLSQRVSYKGTDQFWGDCIESVNSLIEDLVRPSNEMQRVICSVAGGDLSRRSPPTSRARYSSSTTINDIVDQLNGFISEVTRVAREVGTEGKLGQPGRRDHRASAASEDLTDNVNLIAGNLTAQVRTSPR